MPKFLPRVQTLGAKKLCHVGTLEAFHLWIFEPSLKVKRLDSHSPPIKFLDFLHLSTNTHSVKPPSHSIPTSGAMVKLDHMSQPTHVIYTIIVKCTNVCIRDVDLFDEYVCTH